MIPERTPRTSADGKTFLYTTAPKLDDLSLALVSMEYNIDSVQEQVRACCFLRDLAYKPEHHERMMQEDVVSMIVQAMETYPNDYHVIRAAIGALVNLAHGNDAARGAIARADGISLILSAMDTYETQTELQIVACMALENLAYGDTNQRLIARKSGVQAIFSAMERHQADLEVQLYCLGALRSIACHEKGRERIVQKGGIDKILQLLKNNLEDKALHQAGCGTLMNLASKSLDSRLAIAKAGGISLIRRAIKHSADEKQVEADAVLGDLDLSVKEQDETAPTKLETPLVKASYKRPTIVVSASSARRPNIRTSRAS